MASHLLMPLFFGALVITAFTDYYYLLIYRTVTIFLIPVFLWGAYFGLTPVFLDQALWGIVVGYGFLWLFKTVYRLVRHQEGIGQGDLELLAMIGSFLGPVGGVSTITLGSTLGTICAVVLLALKKTTAQTPLPFGSFLAIAGMIYAAFMIAGHHAPMQFLLFH